jgi:hypothetical protein
MYITLRHRRGLSLRGKRFKPTGHDYGGYIVRAIHVQLQVEKRAGHSHGPFESSRHPLRLVVPGTAALLRTLTGWQPRARVTES